MLPGRAVVKRQGRRSVSFQEKDATAWHPLVCFAPCAACPQHDRNAGAASIVGWFVGHSGTASTRGKRQPTTHLRPGRRPGPAAGTPPASCLLCTGAAQGPAGGSRSERGRLACRRRRAVIRLAGSRRHCSRSELARYIRCYMCQWCAQQLSRWAELREAPGQPTILTNLFGSSAFPGVCGCRDRHQQSKH